MTKARGGRQTVPLEEVVLAQAFQLEALLNVLERQRVMRKTEVLEEIREVGESLLERPRAPRRPRRS